MIPRPEREAIVQIADTPPLANALPSICIVIPWFGPWPAWMRFFLESCRWNPTVDWLLFGDAPPPEDLPSNVRIVTVGFGDYRALAASRLGIKPEWTEPYKLCDLKPALGFIHEADIAPYDYWGFGDLDVIYGNIRRFYTRQILVHDLLSTHEHIVSGHFALLRTTPRMLTAFKQIPRWKAHLSSARYRHFDERVFSRLFLPQRAIWPEGSLPSAEAIWRRLITPYLGGGYFQERFSTNLSTLKWVDGSMNFPQQWFWDRGRLTTDRSGDREFLYLHFSHWQSNRWTGREVAAWKNLRCLDKVPDTRPSAFAIGANGFTPLPHLPRANSSPESARKRSD